MTERKKPTPSNYTNIADFVKASIAFRKMDESHFSVLSGCKKLRRVSPALVTQICSGKRKLTLDRVAEFARLLKWTTEEKQFVEDWVARMDPAYQKISAISLNSAQQQRHGTLRAGSKKNVSLHILQDWLNVFVKDAFQIPQIQRSPELIFELLSNLASPKRIIASLSFLRREGYLKTTIDGRTVIDVDLAVATSPLPSQKIRNFHKAVLKIAYKSIDTVPVDRRMVNTMVMPLDKLSYQELINILQEFAEKLQNFSLQLKSSEASQLYQLNLNLVPTGQMIEKINQNKQTANNTNSNKKEVQENEI